MPATCLPACLQAEVEQWYISQGYLLPAYHKVYWLGLATNTSRWPVFTWSSSYAPAAGEAQPAPKLAPCPGAGSPQGIVKPTHTIFNFWPRHLHANMQ
jgi:hypothetical protein